MAAMNVYLRKWNITFAWTKVSQFYLSIPSDQYILWLYIPMKNTFLMQEGSRLENIMTNRSYLFQIK